MASSTLHIKDSFYFEVPKPLWPSHRQNREDFPDVWIELDSDFQLWEARRLHERLAGQSDVPEWPELREQYLAWKADHANFGKPLDVMLQEQCDQVRKDYQARIQEAEAGAGSSASAKMSFRDYVAQTDPDYAWFCMRMEDSRFREAWSRMKSEAGDLKAYMAEAEPWSAEKIEAYNYHLSGKVLIPQYFGRLRNLYEPEAGFCISKFMIVEVVVGLLLLLLAWWIGRKTRNGDAPRGRIWNGTEAILVYIRDGMARAVIGPDEGDRFAPLLWTVFLFVLACNLCGLVPWVGAPTGSFSVTSALAFIIFTTGVVVGMRRFGFLGFFMNQIPSMSLALPMALFIKPMLLAIELLGFCIKHGVLAVRLLANMVAGHLVLLGIMGLAFGSVAALQFADVPDWQWWLTATVSLLAATAFSCLELFVAFLQAFIFTFLSALFIGAAIHHH
jgi:F-type H+-transporting ATPase subunit a